MAVANADASGEATGFDAHGLHYSVERKDGKVVHSETRRDPEGKVVAGVEAEVRFVLGSGSHGKSYLVDHDGRLFQSPISWYTAEKRWDLSPGYRNANQHFERPIPPACLFCHANHFEAVEGTINRYRPPDTQALTIGCERCHGPGALHVREAGTFEGGRDLSIVNPRHLEPMTRDAVCEQCHLQGRVRVERAGRRADDYRPGLPLEEFLVVFVETAESLGKNEAVGQVEQMHTSRCYRATEGQLGCISCHDPHRLPTAAERPAYYRDRCLACHDTHGCSLPEPERRRQSKADSCIECHMPRASLSNIAHTAETNHRIPRRLGETPAPDPGPAANPDASAMPLARFHPAPVALTGSRELDRDLGVALLQWAVSETEPNRARLVRLAEPRLTAAVRDRPDDLPALEARATAARLLARLDLTRVDASLAAAEAVLDVEPKSEPALIEAAGLASIRHRDAALAYARRAIAIDPWVSPYHVGLSRLLAQNRDWRGAAAALREALVLDPTNLDARRRLIYHLLEAGDLQGARAECRVFLAFDPPDADRYRPILDAPH
jgi:tetratricopeptide (TPR) repeat protein